MSSAARLADVSAANASPAPAPAIGELSFMQHRLPLLRDGLADPVARQHARDRTTSLAAKWQILSAGLPQARAETLDCLEATEGKGGSIILQIIDRGRWDDLQASIQSIRADLAACEAAIKELNDFAPAEFFEDMLNTRMSLSGTENTLRGSLTAEAQNAIGRGRRLNKTVEDALASDEIYLRKKHLVESQVSNAKAALEKLNLKIEKVEAFLVAVGC